MEYKLEEIRKGVFLFTTENRYDLCMLFLRYAEFYESPNPEFKGKLFSIIDFMEWYSKEYGNGAFTYPNDWSGFNIPGKTLKEIMSWGGFPEKNKYDLLMGEVLDKILETGCGWDFYLISGITGQEKTKEHELAHAFWFLDKKYQTEMSSLVTQTSSNAFEKMQDRLKEDGYCDEVIYDEIQAYLATGLSDGLKKKLGRFGIKKLREPFIKVFQHKLSSKE